MPSTLPSSFASAAANTSSDPSSRRVSSRTDASGFADWSRRSNGGTQTFRRTFTSSNQPEYAHQRDPSAGNHHNSTNPQTPAYVPPHLSGMRSANSLDMRYSKQNLLDLYKDQVESSDLTASLSDLELGDWDPDVRTGVRWTKRFDHGSETNPGPEICLNHSTPGEPLALTDPIAEELELFSSVNSPLKGPHVPTNRDGSAREVGTARKTSLSHGHGQNLSSPSTARPANRYRDAGDSNPTNREHQSHHANTNTSSKPGREDSFVSPPASLLRRVTDHKETHGTHRTQEEVLEDTRDSSTGPARRVSTEPLSSGLSGPQSPWSASDPSGPFGGLGQLQGSSSNALNQNKRPGGGLHRSESRFRGLMGREVSEEPTLQSAKESSPFGNSGRLNELVGAMQLNKDVEQPTDEDLPLFQQRQSKHMSDRSSGGFNTSDSDALPNLGQLKPPHTQDQVTGFRFPGPQATNDRSRYGKLQDHSNPWPSGSHAEDPTSLRQPNTSLYQSPDRGFVGLTEREANASDVDALHLPGLGSGNGAGIGSALSPGSESGMFEGGQMPSAGQQRSIPPLSELSGLGPSGGASPWQSAPGRNFATRNRSSQEFMGPSGPQEQSQSSTLRGLGNLTDCHFGSSEMSPAANRSSSTGDFFGSSQFPAFQDQLQSAAQALSRSSLKEHHEKPSSGKDTPTSRYPPNMGMPQSREVSLQSGPRGFEQPLHQIEDPGDHVREQILPLTSSMNEHPVSGPPQSSKQLQQPAPGLQNQSNQLPAAQQKQMVMPDRIRWIYRDPQGNTQGPWSGLEMHDWYRAGFFSPELLVRKAEDTDYEPLAQLIRRIGNSREPFLVPQIGIPAPDTSFSGPQWPAQQAPANPAVTSPSAQPPFASSFPSFGTTLTADQQNALERRKQEEQFLMARQKEHLAQQQVMAKQMQVPGHQNAQSSHHSLQHHSSAHSLHSQPSFGSMTSPNSYPNSSVAATGPSQPGQAPVSGFEGSSYRGPMGSNVGNMPGGPDQLSNIKEESSSLMERLFPRSSPYGSGGLLDDPVPSANDDQAAYMAFEERQHLQRQRSGAEGQQASEAMLFDRRLHEFHGLRKDTENYDMRKFITRLAEQTPNDTRNEFKVQPASGALVESGTRPFNKTFGCDRTKASDSLSLTEQVQKAASAKAPSQEATSLNQYDDPVTDSHASSKAHSPLPAPAARRSGGQSVADALNAESISESISPSVETPVASLAPWAKETAESQKQPSLKEIQEAESRKVAKQEEAAAVARRAALDRDTLNLPVPPAPGLPSSSTWGNNDSVVSPSSLGPSAWAKANTSKSQNNTSNGKKTLSQIQKEEEEAARARKQRATNNAGSTTNPSGAPHGTNQSASSGKRYADLASKAATASPPTTSGAWTTVGAGGKPKSSTPGQNAAPQIKTSTGSPPVNLGPATKNMSPAGPSRNASSTTHSSSQDEFKKWAVSKLRPDLNKGIQVEDFVTSLYSLPSDTDLITEAVYSSSSTIDSRHFAEEFIRRRTLAEKGKPQPPSGGATAGTSGEARSGGWNEVARKGPASYQKDESSAFKIVAAKKKSGKK